MSKRHKLPLDLAKDAVQSAMESGGVEKLLEDLRGIEDQFQSYDELEYYKDFLQAMEQAASEHAKFFICRVVSATELSVEYKKRLSHALEKRLKGTVQLEYSLDPTIIGGLSVTCGDWRYTDTVQDKLKQLTKHLTLK